MAEGMKCKSSSFDTEGWEGAIVAAARRIGELGQSRLAGTCTRNVAVGTRASAGCVQSSALHFAMCHPFSPLSWSSAVCNFWYPEKS